MPEKEYIEREAFRREIDEHRPGRSYEDAWALTILDSIPAADVRPVVLCRDCKHWEISKIEPSFHVCTYLCGVSFVRNAEDFCSRGEKREEN